MILFNMLVVVGTVEELDGPLSARSACDSGS
jgi:hypothetical protein